MLIWGSPETAIDLGGPTSPATFSAEARSYWECRKTGLPRLNDLRSPVGSGMGGQIHERHACPMLPSFFLRIWRVPPPL